MKTRTLIAICFVLFVIVCAVELANAQTEYSFEKIHIAGMDLSVVAPDRRMEKAWLHVYLGSTVFTDNCPEIGVPSMTLTIQIWPEIYHDETLVEETPRYKKCDNDPYYVVGGEQLVNDFADSFETMLQHKMLPDIPVILYGRVNSWTELYDLVHEYNDYLDGKLCFIKTKPEGTGYWLYECNLTYMPVHASVKGLEAVIPTRSK